jgi:aryl-alcohol dehydrogenase-like predicted oxidoreductase
MRLILGTAQFGMDYGIRGAARPTKDQVFEILDYALKSGITALDTASGYGEAEAILGEYMLGAPEGFDIISKLPMHLFQNLSGDAYMDAARRSLESSLERLGLPKLKGLLFHNPGYLYDEAAVRTLFRLKELRYADFIGVSVYEPEDAGYALELGMDIIQLPANLFDRRLDAFMEKSGAAVKIYARSVYLQGLLLMDTTEVARKLPSAAEYVESFAGLCDSSHYSRREIALSYLKKKKGVSRIVFGVDNLSQLKENVEVFHKEIPPEIIDEIAKHFENIGEDIVSPLRWRV